MTVPVRGASVGLLLASAGRGSKRFAVTSLLRAGELVVEVPLVDGVTQRWPQYRTPTELDTGVPAILGAP